jgi:Ferritin-like domain
VVSDDDGASRRALLSGAGVTLAGAAALGLAACGRQANTGHESVKKVAAPIQRLDVRILEQLLDLERRTVAAYIAGIPLLSHPDAKTAKQFLDEELEHTGELLSLIKAAGGKGPVRTTSYDLGHPGNAAEVLALLHGLERAQITAYLKAIPRLQPAPVRAAVASILANDAQHIAIIRLARGMTAIPSAFVTGSE